MDNKTTSNGWSEWSRYVFRELELLNARMEKIEQRQEEMNQRLIHIERLTWLVYGLFALTTPIIIWGTIEAIKRIAGV